MMRLTGSDNKTAGEDGKKFHVTCFAEYSRKKQN
jgi:hypothetical protein